MSVARSTFAAALSFVALMALIALLGACAAPAEIRIDRDPDVDLRTYRTFAFSDPSVTGRSPYRTVLGGGLHNATRERLEQQGFVYREQNPDLRVTLVLNPAERKQASLVSPALGSSHHSPAKAATDSDRRRLVAIDIVDARRGVVVWQGLAEQPAGRQPAKNPWPAIGTAVDDILAAFPNGAVK